LEAILAGPAASAAHGNLWQVSFPSGVPPKEVVAGLHEIGRLNGTTDKEVRGTRRSVVGERAESNQDAAIAVGTRPVADF